PIGSFQGSLSAPTAPQLGSVAIRAAVERAGVEPSIVDEVTMGQVITAGVGQAPARQAAIAAGIPYRVPCATVNKVCGSGLYAVMLARRQIALGEAKVVVVGGMESMSKAPYLLPSARRGFRMGDQKAVDAMIHDGLWDPYGNKHMGMFGDLCARERGIDRQRQDDYAQSSYERAIEAQQQGRFNDEIVSVDAVRVDEEPSRFRPEKIPQLRPAFGDDGTITVANASKISDGSAVAVLMSRGEAERRGCKILATIVADATFAHEPAWFTTAPPQAIRKVADRAGVGIDEIDLFEINEAFAVVALAAIDELGLDHAKVNVHGGAISLGHPIGCSGARTLVTLISAMRQRNKRLGCVALCLGGGEAVAMIVRLEED
ncbi:MAG: acetyl-CoA C-acyltransferase, partial [Pirellulales bacterium]|nr:acetyl-CoA C-acyltransferase [Pirellulales bacterium]